MLVWAQPPLIWWTTVEILEASGAVGNATSVSGWTRGCSKRGSCFNKRTPCWHFGCCSFSAIYSSALNVIWVSVGSGTVLLSSLMEMLPFCPLSNKQQATSLPSVRAPTQWREVTTQELFVGGFSTLLDPPYKATHSPDEWWNFTALESVEFDSYFID